MEATARAGLLWVCQPISPRRLVVYRSGEDLPAGVPVAKVPSLDIIIIFLFSSCWYYSEYDLAHYVGRNTFVVMVVKVCRGVLRLYPHSLYVFSMYS